MDFGRMYRKLCLKGAYGVAIRPRGREDMPYQVKYPTMHSWYADPFICCHQGREYVFVERMSSYRLDGEIAVAPVEDGQIGDFQPAIREPFHMSFPNVFSWQGEWYMLPETYESGEVRLYRSQEFPCQWTLDAVLMDGVELLDYALYPAEGGFLVVAHDKKDEGNRYNRAFRLDMEERSFKEIFPEGDWCRQRPGGSFYEEGGSWYHVIQECGRCYGEYLHIYKVLEFTEKVFREEKIREVRMEDVPVMPDNGKLERIHTYNCDEAYEVIDVYFDKVYPNKFFIHQWHEALKRIKGRK